MSQQMNPNTPVGQTSLSVDSGGSVSFDEMMRIDDAPAAEAASKGESPKRAEADDSSSSHDESEKKAAPEGDAKKAKDADESGTERTEKDKNVDTKPGAAKQKLLKGKNGEEQFDVPSDVLLEALVDGKPEPVSVQDLLNNYSGKVAYDKKFTELDKDRKTVKAEKTQLEEMVYGFVQKTTAPDANLTDVIGYLAEFMPGVDPIKLVREFRQKTAKELESYLRMSDVEKRAADAEEENKFLRSRQQSATERAQQTQQQEALRAQVHKVQETHGIDEQGFWSAYEEIAKTGKVPEEAITPAYVSDYLAVTKQFRRVDSVLDNVDPELKTDTPTVTHLVSLIQSDPGISDDKLKAVAEALTDKKAKRSAKSLSDKVRTSNPREVDSPRSSGASPQNQPITFDDLD